MSSHERESTGQTSVPDSTDRYGCDGRRIWPRGGPVPRLLASGPCPAGSGIVRRRVLRVAWSGDERATDPAATQARTPRGPGGTQSAQPATSTTRTWAEMAWLLIGVYWIVMGVFILPIRLHSFRFSDTILFGLVPLAAGLVLRLFGPRIRAQGRDSVSWTHHVAVGLLVTWPLAWVCLIVVAEAML